ncbi:MAG: hypothetical protein HYX21_03225 [Candidatus Yanofskybacteria bacterium]|nr:hypothetical protein [Candidatus Yanofskybacteria bacterium]
MEMGIVSDELKKEELKKIGYRDGLIRLGLKHDLDFISKILDECNEWDLFQLTEKGKLQFSEEIKRCILEKDSEALSVIDLQLSRHLCDYSSGAPLANALHFGVSGIAVAIRASRRVDSFYDKKENV